MKLITHVLREFVKNQQYASVTAAAAANGFPRSSFRDWYDGRNAPEKREHRERLLKLTGHSIFDGPLTAEQKRLALAEYTPSTDLRERADRLAHLIRAAIPDFQVVITQGDEATRDYVRNQLSTEELISFSANARALSSEDARKLIRNEQTATKKKGGGRDHNHKA